AGVPVRAVASLYSLFLRARAQDRGTTAHFGRYRVFKNATSSIASFAESTVPRGCFSFWKTSSSDRDRPSCRNELLPPTPRRDGGLNSRLPTSSRRPTSYRSDDV